MILNLFLSSIPKKPDLDGKDENSIPDISNFNEEYLEYFKDIQTNQELYDLEVIRSQGKAIDYSEINLEKWIDSPTTPKASSSKLPSNEVIMIPISKED